MTFLSLVEAARQRLGGMRIGKELQKYVVQVCADPLTLGHRGELALAHSALAWAAWQGKATGRAGRCRCSPSVSFGSSLAGDAP